jgi:hypothetical protein
MTTAEFVVEAAGLDFDEVARAAGVEPTLVRRSAVAFGGGVGLCDQWVLAVSGDLSVVEAGAGYGADGSGDGFREVSMLLGPLDLALRPRVDVLATYCRSVGARTFFRVTADSPDESVPVTFLTTDFVGLAARLGAEFRLKAATAPLVEDDSELEDDAAPPVRWPERVRHYSPRDTILVAGTSIDAPYGGFVAVRRTQMRLAEAQALVEVGSHRWAGRAVTRRGYSYLFADSGWQFDFAEAAADPYVVVGFADELPGLAVDVTGRVFSPGLVARFAPEERAYILSGQTGTLADGLAGEVPGTGGVADGIASESDGMVGGQAHFGVWPVLSPDANKRALEVWAKKRAYLYLRQRNDERGLDGFSVMCPEALECVFWPFWFAEAPELIGWACTDDFGVKGVDTVWSGPVDELGNVAGGVPQ